MERIKKRIALFGKYLDIDQRRMAVAIAKSVRGNRKPASGLGGKIHGGRLAGSDIGLDIVAMQMQFGLFVSLPLKINLIALLDPNGPGTNDFALFNFDGNGRHGVDALGQGRG